MFQRKCDPSKHQELLTQSHSVTRWGGESSTETSCSLSDH